MFSSVVSNLSFPFFTRLLGGLNFEREERRRLVVGELVLQTLLITECDSEGICDFAERVEVCSCLMSCIDTSKLIKSYVGELFMFRSDNQGLGVGVIIRNTELFLKAGCNFDVGLNKKEFVLSETL